MNRNHPDILDRRFASLLVEAMADGVFTLNNSGKITSWNPSMERITGYSASDVIGKDCRVIGFDRCLGKSCPNGLQECGIFKHGSVDSKKCSMRHKAGHSVPVLKNARIVKDDKGFVKGVVETVTDLSELYDTRRQMEEASIKLKEVHHLNNIIGKSSSMQDVFFSIQAAARSDATVLIQGESGTGKELVAGAIHYNSERVDKPLITVNCSALSEPLLESELFGHAKGSFTGAIRDRIGRFEEASYGTVFLDEIAEISPLIQVKLLRVLQEKEIERVGESKTRKTDIRIIAASNKDLYELVKKGEFREDLYYRLKVFPVNVPPLRERKEDIPLLADHFVKIQNKKTGKEITEVSTNAMRIFMDYPWPGNVRELENAIEHGFVLCQNSKISKKDLPIEIRKLEYSQGPVPTQASASEPSPGRKTLSRKRLLELLDECGWNKAEAARRVGLSRTSIWKYMKKWKIPLKRPN